jgi:hypothetical protein
MTTKIQNAHKIFTMVLKYCKRPEYITTFSTPRFSNIYPNSYFCSEKKPSGNPGAESLKCLKESTFFLGPFQEFRFIKTMFKIEKGQIQKVH